MSSSYRCVNFYDLCRLCTACTEQKIHIFSSEGKLKNLSAKIAECLPLVVDEKDRLPKILCPQCVQHVENIAEFRNICKNSQTMLNSCLNTATAQNGGKVYIKDAVAAASGRSQSVLGNVSNALNINATTISTPTLVSTPTTLQTLVNQSVAGVANSNILQTNDFLSSIMQAVGLQSTESVQSDKPQVVQQYTITLDNKGGFKTEPMEYKITANTTAASIPTSVSTAAPITPSGTVPSYNSEKESRHNALEEFLKMKPNIKVTPIKKKQQQTTKQQETAIQQQQQQQPQPTLPLQTSVQEQFHPQQQQQIQQQQYTQVAQLQLQQLQQQLQQQFQQQQLNQQLQNITAQLQPQHPQQITITAPAMSSDALSPSKNKKPKLNFVLTSPTSQTLAAPQPQIQLQLQHTPVQQHHSQQQSVASTLLQNLAPFLQQQQPTSQSHQQSTMLSPNKCFLPITIKDENSDQQIVAHIDAKNFMLPTTYQLQMKLQPHIATVDGQPIMHLTPTSIPATLQIAPQTLSNQTFQAAAANQIQQQLQMQQTIQQQQAQQQSPLQHVQITSQQIIQAGTKTINKTGTHNNSNTHDAATSTSDQLDEIFTTTNNNLQSTEQSIKPPQKYRITQHTGSNTIEITPTRNLTQQIMQQVQQQQQKSQQQQQNLATTTGTLATKTTTTLPTQHGGITVQRITTTKAAAAKTHQQHPKLPMLSKQNVTISRITPQQQQKQQHQQQQQQPQKPVANTTQQQVKLPQQPQKAVTTNVNQQQTLQQNRVTTAMKNKLSPTKKLVRPSRPTTTSTTAATTTTTTTTTTETTAAAAKPQSASTTTVTYQQTVGDTGSTSDSGAVVVSNGSENFTVVTLPAAHGVGLEGLECSQCGRIFKKKEHLTQHLKLHAGVRPFKCTEEGCEKDFSRKEHLLRHIISHTGKKMFSCEVCQKLFSRKDNLNKHKRMHLDQPSSNNYTCEICHKVFTIKIYYEQHKSIHEKDKVAAAATKLDKEKVLQKTLHQVQQQETITVSQQTPHQHQHHQQIQIVQQQQQAQPSYTQHQAQSNHTQQQQQQHQPQQQIMHLQLPAGVVTTQDLANNTITITQSSDPNNPNSVKAIGSHDATVLNLPTSLANFVQLGQAQFVNATTGEIMGHIKIEK